MNNITLSVREQQSDDRKDKKLLAQLTLKVPAEHEIQSIIDGTHAWSKKSLLDLSLRSFRVDAASTFKGLLRKGMPIEEAVKFMRTYTPDTKMESADVTKKAVNSAVTLERRKAAIGTVEILKTCNVTKREEVIAKLVAQGYESYESDSAWCAVYGEPVEDEKAEIIS